MTETKKPSIVRAIKNISEGSVLIYKAVNTYDNNYELSVEQYKNDILIKEASAEASFDSLDTLDSLLLDMCKGELEPCHLKDIIEDLI